MAQALLRRMLEIGLAITSADSPQIELD